MSIEPLRHDPPSIDVEPALLDKESHFQNAAQRLRRLATGAKRRVDPAVRALLEDLLDAAAATEQTLTDQRQRISELESLSSTDELTGALNRRGFWGELDRALARARRHGEQGLLVYFDLDDFKAVNDTYGHPAGDAVLEGVAEVLRLRTRSSDAVARLGGDEFAVLLTDTPPSQAPALVGELGRLLNRLVIGWGKTEIPVSASLGAVPYDSASSTASLQLQADRALYRNKHERKLSFRGRRPG